MRNPKQPVKTDSKKKRITLMSLLANSSTDGSRKLLKKYNQPDALNHEDLENKLAKLYVNAPDKIVFEKELAEIHPHKEWLLDQLKEDVKEPIENPLETLRELVTEEPISNACGCSSFEGQTQASNTQKPDNTLLVLGILGMITILVVALKVPTK